MEGRETQTKSEGGEALRSRAAIRCAKAALLLSSLKSSPNRSLDTAIDNDDILEKEILRREIGDLKMEVARERLQNKRIKLCGFLELLLQLVLLLALSTFFFMLAFENGAS
ncbi:hypothetical protein CerSpe_055620 [Prunus speciosa]